MGSEKGLAQFQAQPKWENPLPERAKEVRKTRGKGATSGEYLELSIDSDADGNSYYLI